jgi:hypothetical protein
MVRYRLRGVQHLRLSDLATPFTTPPCCVTRLRELALRVQSRLTAFLGAGRADEPPNDPGRPASAPGKAVDRGDDSPAEGGVTHGRFGGLDRSLDC